MPDKNSHFNITQTKLFRPTIVSDFVSRPRLNELLDKGSRCKLTLVCAPAGYGKSLLVSSWLEPSDRLHCWVSLDNEMNDLVFFLQHILSTMRKVFPDGCPTTLSLLNSSEPQSPNTISTEFVNELLEIKTPFTLVLDDYGFIHNQDINELLVRICKFAPPSLQLVVITRRDPPFPLHLFRAQADLVELRQTDLQFTLPETVSFLEKTISIDLDEQTTEYVQNTIEGWPVGLRLLVLSLQSRGNINDLIREMKGDSRHIQEYLMSEVLLRQSPSMREGLLKTSILGSFCAPLYTTLCHPDCCEQCGPECDGNLFVQQLQESNIFCIGLDEQGEWFRYHHLFQQLLQRTLENRYSAEEIAELHKRASIWFENKGMIEEAFDHALIINDFNSASTIVARNRHEIMNREQWGRLRRFMKKLPRELVEKNPELLMQDAWVLWNQIRIGDMAKVLDRVESLLVSVPIDGSRKDEIQGEVDALRSLQYYLIPPCDGQRALAHAKNAIRRTPLHNPSTRGMAIVMLAMSYQLTGNISEAFKVILEELNQREAQQNTYHTRLLITLCMIYWLVTDLSYMMQTAKKLLNLSRELSLRESREMGQHYVGLIYYCRNELVEAEKYLGSPVISTSKTNIFNFAHSAFVLSLTYLAQGRQEKAKQTAESVVQYALDTGNTPLFTLGNAFNAELALRLGNVSEAVRWTKKYEPEPFTTAHRYYVPQLTYARVLILQNSKNSTKQAEDLLDRLYDFYQSIYHKYCLINVLALQAMLANSMGDVSTADKKLTKALTQAEHSGHIRLFLDLGPDMAKLLERQDREGSLAVYVQRLKEAFTKEDARKHPDTVQADYPATDMETGTSKQFSNPLTNREQEIIELFAKRLSNQEIAEKLFIADNTVKRHATNIFRKLEVKNRRQAVAQANHLGITS